jgi:hypothetical protein
MFCSPCGASNPDGASFCSACGKPVAVPPTRSKAVAPPIEAYSRSTENDCRPGDIRCEVAALDKAVFGGFQLRSIGSEALATLIHMSRQKHTAITCAAAVPRRCHRSLVADALSVRGIPAVEILSESSYRLHKLTPFAHGDGTHITYPPEQSRLLL